MRILDRYIIRQFALPFLWCLFVFFFLYVIIDLFGHLDEIIKKGVGWAILYRYYLSFVPIIFVQTCPVAILLSTLYTLGNLNKNNEITGMKASGVSLFKIAFPFLCTGLILSLLVLIVNDYYVPEATFSSTKIKEEEIEKEGTLSQKIINDVTLYGEDNRIYYAKRYDLTEKTLYEIDIRQQDNLKRERITMKADKACWDTQAGKWRFYKLVIFHKDTRGQTIGKPIFKEEVLIEIKESPEDFIRHQDESSFMSYRRLKNRIRRLSAGGYSPHKELIDLYRKISFPFANLIVVLLGIPFALSAPRSGALIGIGLSVGIGLLYYGLEAIIIAVGKEGWLPPLAASWLTNIIFSGVGLVLLYRLRLPR